MAPPAYGVWEERVIIKPSIALDGGTIADLLTVSGGPVLITLMAMEITEAVSAHACTMAWESDPTAGSNNVPIGTALDINGYGVGDFVYAECDGTALIYADVDAGTALAQGAVGRGGIVVPIGGIDMVMANSDPTSGIGTMFVRYKPLNVGAKITR